jgi:hypothetical protein
VRRRSSVHDGHDDRTEAQFFHLGLAVEEY